MHAPHPASHWPSQRQPTCAKDWSAFVRSARRPHVLHKFHQPKEQTLSLKPLKPSKQSRNSKKQETKRLLEQQQRPQPNPVRLEEVVFKRLG